MLPQAKLYILFFLLFLVSLGQAEPCSISTNGVTRLATGGVTFKVTDAEPVEQMSPPKGWMEYLKDSKVVKDNNGQVLFSTRVEGDLGSVYPNDHLHHNGFVGAALMAYNYHLHLVLKPDDVWLAITTSLARYIDKHAEKLRYVFVNHEGQEQLLASSGGSILTADYDYLTDQICDLMDARTKEGIVDWVTNSFSTTTKKERLVSKLVLMGAMKLYFSYSFSMACNLPQVTLEGTVEDWKDIQQRIGKMKGWSPELAEWASVLEWVMNEFIVAAEGNPNTEFWNRIVTVKPAGSGSPDIKGWVLAFVGFSKYGRYFLNPLHRIKETNDFGSLDINSIPQAVVEVPIDIDDNGREYKTIFYAGLHAASFDKGTHTVRPSADWALIDVTPSTPSTLKVDL